MSEKKENIKSGLDIEFEGGTVLNGVSVAEKDLSNEVTPNVNVETSSPENSSINTPTEITPKMPVSMPGVDAAVKVPEPVVSEIPVSSPLFSQNDFTQVNLNNVNLPNSKSFNESFNVPYGSSLKFSTKEEVEDYRKRKHEEVDKECDSILAVVEELAIEKTKIQTIKNNIFGSVFKDENKNFGGMNTSSY